MVKKIGKSIFIVSLIVLFSSIFIIISFLYGYYNSNQIEQQKNQLTFVASGVEKIGMDYFKGMSQSDYRITYIDNDGTVLYDTNADINKMENHAGREEFKKAQKSGYGESSRVSKTLKEKTVYCAKKLSDDSVIRISVTRLTTLSILLGIIYPVVLVVIIAIILSVIFSSTLSKKIVKPLSNLDLEHPLENEVYDELSPLLVKLDKQNKKINLQIKNIEKKNNEINYITENVNEGIIILNNNGNLISANKAASELFNCKENDYYLDFCRKMDYKQTVEDALQGNNSSAKIVIDNLTYKISASAITLADKEFAVFLFITDISEEENASKMRREFSANVSHELKTPLTSIIGSAEIIENGIAAPADIPHFAGKIGQEAKRLLELIQDIIKISRLDENEMTSEFTEIELSDICKTVYNNLDEKARKHNITLNLISEEVKINGFGPILYEMIYNLCDNAINYNKPDGHVTLTLKDDNGKAVICVEDDGIGISKEDQPHIFERFYRADKSHSKETGGTGLGLSIVKHACNIHKANIMLVSQIGKGTTITIKF